MKKYSRVMSNLTIMLVGIMLNNLVIAAQSPYATTVIINGKVITVDSDNIHDISFAEAIAIREDEIIAVGSNSEIQQYIANWTETIDAKGNTVLPGLIDTHNHLYETTLTSFPWVLNAIPELIQLSVSAESPDELVDNLGNALAARVKQIPEGQWIQVRVNPAQVAVQAIGRTLTRQFLDPLTPNNPVVVSTRGGAVYNTQGIESIEARYRNPIPDDFWTDETTGWSGDYTDGPRCVRSDIILPQSNRRDEYTRAYFQVMRSERCDHP